MGGSMYTDIAKIAGHLPHRYGKSRAIWDHTVLPATRHWWHPRLYPSRSWYSIERPRRDARLSWPSKGLRGEKEKGWVGNGSTYPGPSFSFVCATPHCCGIELNSVLIRPRLWHNYTVKQRTPYVVERYAYGPRLRRPCIRRRRIAYQKRRSFVRSYVRPAPSICSRVNSVVPLRRASRHLPPPLYWG